MCEIGKDVNTEMKKEKNEKREKKRKERDKFVMPSL